jgi:hypothetical protein
MILTVSNEDYRKDETSFVQELGLHGLVQEFGLHGPWSLHLYKSLDFIDSGVFIYTRV